MIKKIIILLLIIAPIFVMAEDNTITYYNEDDKLVIKGNHIELYLDGELTHSLEFVKTSINKINYYSSTNSSEKWLILRSNDLIFVYDGINKYPIFRGSTPIVRKRSENLGLIQSITASSSLTEGKNIYLPTNLGTDYLETPWVEGVSGTGIGEKLYLGEGRVHRLFISNGYVSYKKPNLYERNGRIKSIKIKDVSNDREMIIELKDIPDPQLIDFGDSKIRKLEIEILDIYKGTDYEDTCINFLMVEYF